jgi:hypothetical protein
MYWLAVVAVHGMSGPVARHNKSYIGNTASLYSFLAAAVQAMFLGGGCPIVLVV